MKERAIYTPFENIIESEYNKSFHLNCHNEDNKFILFCQNCKYIPLIKFIDFKSASVSCNCIQENQQMTYEQIFTKFFMNVESNSFNNDYLICKKHNETFKFYCENCELNLCDKCQENQTCHIRYKQVLKFFGSTYIKPSQFLLNSDNKSFNLLRKINLILLKQFQKYPNYNLKQNIISLYKLNKTKENSSYDVLNLENKQYIHINSLVNKDLRNLIELCLKDNKLKNEQIPDLKKLNCHNLLILNLESNFFTSYLLLTVNENFPKLKVINLSSNRLYEDINIFKNKLIPYYSVRKLNLSNGVFSNNTIFLLSCLIFSELECLDLSSNNLSSLSFILNINFGNNINKIKQIIALNNEYFSINSIVEYIDYLTSNYVSLKQLILEEEYSIEYKESYNLPFQIICFDENKKGSYLIEEYEKEKNKSDNRLNTLLDYQGFCDN